MNFFFLFFLFFTYNLLIDVGYRSNDSIISLFLEYFFILLDLNFFQYWNKFLSSYFLIIIVKRHKVSL